MWDFNLICSELESVFSATHCLRVQQVAAPTSSSSGRRAVPHVRVWPLPLGHRPAVFTIFPSTPDHLRWAINLHLLHLLNRRLALHFLQVVQGVVTIWDLEKWCKNQSKISQPQGLGGSLGAFSCLVLSELVNRVAVDLAVRVAGQVAGARHVCSEFRGLKKKAGGLIKEEASFKPSDLVSTLDSVLCTRVVSVQQSLLLLVVPVGQVCDSVCHFAIREGCFVPPAGALLLPLSRWFFVLNTK